MSALSARPFPSGADSVGWPHGVLAVAPFSNLIAMAIASPPGGRAGETKSRQSSKDELPCSHCVSPRP
jgi:hypothetical protein